MGRRRDDVAQKEQLGVMHNEAIYIVNARQLQSIARGHVRTRASSRVDVRVPQFEMTNVKKP